MCGLCGGSPGYTLKIFFAKGSPGNPWAPGNSFILSPLDVRPKTCRGRCYLRQTADGTAYP